jgi:hypothetical protein
MKKNARRDTAAPPPPKADAPAARKKSIPRRVSTKWHSTPPPANVEQQQQQSTQSSLPSSPQVLKGAAAAANDTTTTATSAEVAPSEAPQQQQPSPVHLKPPLSVGKKPRKDDTAAPSAAEGHNRKRSATLSASPLLPYVSKDTPAILSVNAGVTAPTAKRFISSATSVGNSNSGAGGGVVVSRAGSVHLSPGQSPALPNSLMSPINEIHGSLAQLYLTPISASLSSSSPHSAAFAGLHFDGRRASWSNGAPGGLSPASPAAATPGCANPFRCQSSSSSQSSAARPRNASIADNSNGFRESGGSGSAGWTTENSPMTGQPPPIQRTRIKSTTTSPPRQRNSVHSGSSSGSGSSGRPRPTFSATSFEANTAGSAGPRDPKSRLNHSTDPVSPPLSVTNTTLFATTSTLAIPLTPPMPPPLMSTMKPPSTPAGGRQPPSPPPLDGSSNNTHSGGYAAGEEGESGSGSGSSSGGGGEADDRRGLWNLTSSWSPAESSPAPLVSSMIRPVGKASRRVSHGSSTSGSDTAGSSTSKLELSEDQLMPEYEDDPPLRQRSQGKYSNATTATDAFANSRTAAMSGSGDTDGSSPIENSMYSVSFVSVATSAFDEQPPPPPPPPAQLILGRHGGGGAGRNASPASLLPTAAAPSLTPSFSMASDASGTLFLEADMRQHPEKDRQEGHRNSASLSVGRESIGSLHPDKNNSSNDDGGCAQLVRHGSFFSSSRVSLGEAEPFLLTSPGSGKEANDVDANQSRRGAAGNDLSDDAGSSLMHHGASYGVKRDSWSSTGVGDGAGAGSASFSQQPGSPSGTAAGGDAPPSKTQPPPPALKGTEKDAVASLNDGVASDAAAPLEFSLVLPEQSSIAGRLTAHDGKDVSSRQQELAQSFRNRIQVGVRAPRRKQTVRRVSANARNQRSGSSSSSGSGSQRSAGARSGSSGSSGSRRRGGSSRRSGKNSIGTLSSGAVPTFIRASFVMLAAAKFMKAVAACRARHRFNEVDAPRAAFAIQCAWRRHQQRRRIRERNAVQLLVPWVRLHLKRLRKIKEVSALLLQRVFRGQKDRSFHQFLYARMQYNKALDVVLRAVRRWEAQKMLFGLRLQRDERVVLIQQCIQGCLQVLRAEQLEWNGLVESATVTLCTRPCVTTADWVLGVAARTGVVLNPTAATSGAAHLFDLLQQTANSTYSDEAGTRVDALRRQLQGIAELESHAYLDSTQRTRKTNDPHISPCTVSAPSQESSATQRRLSATLDEDGEAAVSAAVSEDRRGAETTAFDGAVVLADSPVLAVTDDDVVDAYVQLLVRIECAERAELERELLAAHEAVLRTPTLVNQAVSYIVAQQLPLLFAPLLLAMPSKSAMRQAIRLFEAERTARCQIIKLYESMPLACLSRPMLNPAAGQRHDNLVQLVNRTADPWLEAEQNERRLYQEWTTYLRHSNCGASVSKSLTSGRVSYGQNPYVMTPMQPPLPEDNSPLSLPLETVTSEHLFANKTHEKGPPLSEKVVSSTQRLIGGVRVRMAAPMRSAGAASVTQSPSSLVLTAPPANSVSISGAPSDNYTRAEAKSKTAIPCPKRRPRGPPLPLLRMLAPASTRGQGTSPNRPSFRGSVSNSASPFEQGIAAGADLARHRPTAIPDLVVSTSPLHDGGPDRFFGRDMKEAPPSADPDNFTCNHPTSLLSQERRALELHHRLSTTDDNFAPAPSSRLNSLWLVPSPLRSDRRTTAPPPALPSSVFLIPTRLPPAISNGGARERAAEVPSRPSLVRVPLEKVEGDEYGSNAAVESRYASSFNGSPSTNSRTEREVPIDAVDSLVSRPFSDALDGPAQGPVEAQAGSQDAVVAHSSWSDAAASPQLRRRGDSWASSSSSVASSAASFVMAARNGGVASAAKGQTGCHLPVVPPRRPPTPPPRHCYTQPATPTPVLAGSPVLSFNSSKGGLETLVAAAVGGGVFETAPATSLSSRNADEFPGAGGRASLPLLSGQRPESRESSGSSNTNWTLSSTIKAVSPTAAVRLPSLPERQTPNPLAGFAL